MPFPMPTVAIRSSMKTGNNSVLVTGATGFIGRYFVPHLLQNGFNIRILARERSNILHFPSEVEVIRGDLVHPDTLTGICKNITTVFHLGGYAHAMNEKNSHFASQHDSVNFHGTQHILTEAKRAKVKKFIFFSSVKAVGEANHCIDETWQKSPDSPYGKAKREAENIILEAKETGLHVCILRPSLVYGPAWKGNLANMLRAIDRGIFPPLPQHNNCRSMVSVFDLGQAALLAARNPLANGKIYFVTDGINYSTYQLAQLMREALGKKKQTWFIPLGCLKSLAFLGDKTENLIRRRLPFNTQVYDKLFESAQYSSKRIQEELGYIPRFDLQKVLPDIIAFYKKQSDRKIP